MVRPTPLTLPFNVAVVPPVLVIETVPPVIKPSMDCVFAPVIITSAVPAAKPAKVGFTKLP